MPIRSRVSAGERKLYTDEYNAFLRGVRQPRDVALAGSLTSHYPPTIAYIKNITAGKVEAFGVLGIDSPVVTRDQDPVTFFGSPTMNGVLPDIDEHKGKFAILQEPAMPGDIVRAVIAGATWAWLNIDNADDTTADIEDGVRSYVKTGTGGTAKILWKEDGTGTNKAGLIVLNAGCCSTGIPFRNDSSGSETVPAYGVMRITGSVDIDGTEHVTVAKPNTDFKRKYLVNGSTAVPYNETGKGTWLEEADWVLYDDANTPALGESWGPKNDSWKLNKWRYGFTIVGNPSGGSTDIVRAWQEEANEFIGKTDSTHNKNSQGTISIYDGNLTDTTDNMASVENKFANVSSSKWVQVRWNAGKWHLVAAEC